MKTKIEISQWEASEIVRHLSNYHIILQILSVGKTTDEDILFMKRWCKQKPQLGTRIDATMDKLFIAQEADYNKVTHEKSPH